MWSVQAAVRSRRCTTADLICLYRQCDERNLASRTIRGRLTHCVTGHIRPQIIRLQLHRWQVCVLALLQALSNNFDMSHNYSTFMLNSLLNCTDFGGSNVRDKWEIWQLKGKVCCMTSTASILKLSHKLQFPISFIFYTSTTFATVHVRGINRQMKY